MIPEDLETKAYEVFVYPNLSIIELIGKNLKLKEETIKRAQELAIEYIKKTYHQPRYSHIKFLLPAFVYIAAILDGDRRTQYEIAQAFGVTESSVRKWYLHIKTILDIKIIL
jgi:transcription initiation factor TFIIIB Brf1 subunit/transcription initiation factor TFIIB